MNILGGIDQILRNYYNGQRLLNKKQIENIYDLIKEENEEDINDDIEQEVVYSFFTHNTLIYKLFGNEKIMNVLYSKLSILIQCGINMGYPTLLVIVTRISLYNKLLLIIYCIFSLYYAFTLLSINNYAFKIIYQQTFDFWLKLLYTILLCISYGIYQIFFVLDDMNLDIMSILSVIFQILSVLLMVLNLCCIDSLQFPAYLKCFGGLSLSILFIVMSIYFTMNSFKIKSNDSNNIIALMSFIGNSSQIIAIYMLHHTYISIKYPKQCVLLRPIPNIHWIDKYHLNPNIVTMKKPNPESIQKKQRSQSSEGEPSEDNVIESNQFQNKRQTEIVSDYILEQQKHEKLHNSQSSKNNVSDNTSNDIDIEEKEKKEPNIDAMDIQITSMDKDETNSIQTGSGNDGDDDLNSLSLEVQHIQNMDINDIDKNNVDSNNDQNDQSDGSQIRIQRNESVAL